MLPIFAALVANRYVPRGDGIKSQVPVALIVLTFLITVGTGLAQTNVLKYLELRDIGATPAEIILSPDFQTIIEFDGLAVQSASSGRADQITVEFNEQTIRLRANQDTVNTDLTVVAGGKTALFILRSDPSSNTPRRYVVKNSPPPALTSLSYEGIEGKTDLSALEVGTKDLPPGVTLNLRATMDNKGDVALQYILTNDGEVAIVNEPSRLSVLNEDIKLRYTLSRVPPAGSVNVIPSGESEYGTVIVPNPPNGQLTFLWVLVQLGPGGHYAATVDISDLLEAPQGTSATVGTPAPQAATVTTAPQETAQTTDTPPVNTVAAQQGGGVTLYEHSDFGGASVLLVGDGPISFYRAEQGQFGSVPDNAVSSLVVPEGYSILLCDVQATFPCKQFSSGSYATLEPNLNDRFSFAQVSVTKVIETSPADPQASLLNATFEVNDESWKVWADPVQNGEGQGQVVGGQYCLAIQNGGDNVWGIQFMSPDFLSLQAGHSYKVRFDAKADSVNGAIVRVNESVEPYASFLGEEFQVDAGQQAFEYSFSVDEDKSKIQLSFYLGGELSKGPNTVCFDNIVLQDITQNEYTTQTQETAAANTPDLAGTYALVASHSGLCTDVLRFSEDNGASIGQWTCNNEINQRWTLKRQGNYYKVIAEHSRKCLDVSDASTEDGHKVHQWECIEVGNQLWSFKQVAQGYQIVASHSGKCLAVLEAAAEGGAGFVQETCSSGADKTNDVFTLTPAEPVENVVVETSEGAIENATSENATSENVTSENVTSATTSLGDNLLTNSGFDEIGARGWEVILGDGAKGVAKVNDSEYCFNILNGGPSLWSTRLQQNGFNLEGGQPYLLSFEAYANEPRTVTVDVGQHYEPWTARAMQSFVLQKEKQTYLMPFVANTTEDPISYVDFLMGGELATNSPFQICFDNVTLQKGTLSSPHLADVNQGSILANPHLDEAQSSVWKVWAAPDTGAQIIGEIKNGEYCVYVEQGGSEAWHTQFLQRQFLLEPGVDYTLSFDAYTDKPHSVRVKVGQGYEPWGEFLGEKFKITRQKQAFTLPFSLEKKEPNSSLEFWFGGAFTRDLPAQTCFDNITITRSNADTESNMTAAQ
jgi:hypothetical protein